MSADQVPLYVRLSEEPSRKLERAVSVTGKSKRQIVEEAVTLLLNDDGFVVGRAEIHEDRPEPPAEDQAPPVPEVMTLSEASALLRTDPKDLKAAASAGRVPARRIGGKWRFSRVALLAWLDNSDAR